MMTMQNRSVLVPACMGLAVIAWAATRGDLGSAEAELAREEERGQRHELKRALREAFAAFIDETHEQLRSGRLSLPQASAQVLSYCRECYPTYLDHLYLVEKGASGSERIARNLVRYFRTRFDGEAKRTSNELLARLEAQLQQMQREQPPTMPVSTSDDEPRYGFQE